MTMKRLVREMRTVQAAMAEFDCQAVRTAEIEALPGIVAMLRQQRAKREASHGPCPFQEQADYGWNDGAVPSIRESGKPGSPERIEALRAWYSVQTSIEEEDGTDEACSSAFIPTTNVVGNVRLSDSILSISAERNTSED